MASQQRVSATAVEAVALSLEAGGVWSANLLSIMVLALVDLVDILLQVLGRCGWKATRVPELALAELVEVLHLMHGVPEWRTVQ